MEMTSELFEKHGIRKIIHHTRTTAVVLLVDRSFADNLRGREGQDYQSLYMPIAFRIDQIIDIDDTQSMILGGNFQMDGYCKSVNLPGFCKGDDSGAFIFKL